MRSPSEIETRLRLSRRIVACLLVSTVLAGCVRNEDALDDIDTPPTDPTPTPLRVTAPASVQSEATAPMTTLNLGQPTPTGGDGTYTVSNDAPAGFPLGMTMVTWSVSDGAGASVSAMQSVAVMDTTPPMIVKPADVQAVSTGAMTTVALGSATATDLVDQSPTVSHNAPAAGFPVGTTTVAWMAGDASGNVSTTMQMVTITDSNGQGNLALTAPAAVQAEATGQMTSPALGNATATGGQGQVNISNNAPAGGFPVGATTVVWTATDANSATATANQIVTINDTTPPAVIAPAAVTVVSMGALTTVDVGQATAVDLADPAPTIINDAPAAGFPEGMTTVVWTATDASGNTATANQQVTVNAIPVVACSTLEPQFANVVYPILDTANVCSGCHTPPNVVSTPNGFNMLANDTTGFNLFKTIAKIQVGSESIVSVKALGGAAHGGGDRFPGQGSSDPNYQAIAALAQQLVTCTETPVASAQVLVGTPYEQVHKITTTLASRTPLASEVATVEAAADDASRQAALANIVDGIVTEDAFYLRLKEIYNDLLLTDKDANSTQDVNSVFDIDDFANEEFFESFDNNVRNTLERNANFGLARAPLELIEYVVRNDRPFTEILTASYTMVNPYSAVIYDADVGDPNFRFDSDNDLNNHDRNEFRPAPMLRQADGDVVPTAGVISTHAFLDRYRSTNTNINRERGRWFYYYFLGVDVEGLAPRDGLDLDNVIGDVPTFEDPQCTVCHNVLDPVAGLFKNRRNEGRYRVENNWHHLRTTNGVPRMLPPGYTMDPADELPAANADAALPWLAQRTVQDDRFAMQTVRTIFRGLTRIEETSSMTTAFLSQVKDDFVTSGFDLKALVRSIALSDYFLARNIDPTVNPVDFADFGTGRLTTPEELHRAISAVAGGGYEWEGPSTNSTLVERHRLLYGGIDSNDVTDRATTANSLIDGIQRRIANQVACERVAEDLTSGGMLFPVAGLTDTPADTTGQDRIRQNIQFLHRHLLGEELAIDDAEIDATYQLFLDVRAAGETAIPSGCRGGAGNTDTNGTVLPWMAVVAYLLSDFHFTYD